MPIKPCPHPNILVLEVAFVKRYQTDNNLQYNYDYSVGLALANTLRVRKYYCQDCQCVLLAPDVGNEETVCL